MVVFHRFWTWHLSTFHSVNWVFILSLSWSTFMSHVTLLSLSNNALSIIVLFSTSLSQCCQVYCHATRCSKGSLKFTSAVKTTFVSVLLSQSDGYIIYNIPELCSKFRVVDVGFIMALLWLDYSCRHQLKIQELFLETSLVPWDLYASMTDSLALDIGSHHWPLIKRFDWVFDIKKSIHTQYIVLWYLGNHWHQWWSPLHLLTVHIIGW